MNEIWSINVGNEEMCALRSNYALDNAPIDPAMKDLFQDEWGCPAEVTEDDAVFDMVGLPDDIANSDPCADGIVLLVGELLDQTTLRELVK